MRAQKLGRKVKGEGRSNASAATDVDILGRSLRSTRLLNCDYCQGCFHTTEKCKEQLEHKRQHKLLNTVRIASQEDFSFH